LGSAFREKERKVRNSTTQESSPVAFISALADDVARLKEASKLPCFRHGIDPNAFGWPQPIRAETLEYMKDRISSADLFIGIYRKEIDQRTVGGPHGGTPSTTCSQFDLTVACEHLPRESVLCFVEAGDSRSREVDRLLHEHRRAFTIYEFEDARGFALVLDQALRRWITRVSEAAISPPADTVISIRIECRDRHGVLARLAEKIFREGGNVMRAENRVHLNRTHLQLIASWPRQVDVDAAELRGSLEQALEGLFGEKDATVTVSPIVDQEGVVTSRGLFRVLFFDGAGVAEQIFRVLAQEELSVVESNLATIPASPMIGRIDLWVNASGSEDARLGLVWGRLNEQPNVITVERLTERGRWWY